ncbi:MAG: bifunctional hydroxymethylpyrimidine kinase/phosphomethylpyrimidine kinase [Acidimicrobiales bacterium]
MSTATGPSPLTGQPPRALTIAGSDSGGGAGLQADLKTFLASRVHGMSAVTAVTVQNSLGVSGFYEMAPHAVAEQIEAVVTDIGVDAAKTGMLASAAVIEAVASSLRRLGVQPLVVDPVAASQHGDPLLRPDALASLTRELFPLAALVTPNLGETRLLTGIDVANLDQMKDAARALHGLGPRFALVKGGHLDGPTSVDVLYDGSDMIELSAPRHATMHTHGSGDTLAAATCAALARGLDMVAAVRAGKAFVTRSVQESFPLGKGLGPVGHFWRVRDFDEG